jgi:hypothetical protein
LSSASGETKYFIEESNAVRPDLRQFLPEIRNVCEALESVYASASKARSILVPVNAVGVAILAIGAALGF